jgi:hypothetical protein
MMALAWLVPGAAHVMLGHTRKGVVFFAALMTLCVLGLAFRGQIVPLQMGEPLALLMALAEWGMGVPRLMAPLLGFGAGEVTATTYEYGNTFLISAGLLNTLVVLNAGDVAAGRKPR